MRDTTSSQYVILIWRLSIMVTKTKSAVKSAVKTDTLKYYVSESVTYDVIQTEFNFADVTKTAHSLEQSENSLIMKLFIKAPIPTFKDYQNWRKEQKLSHVTSKDIGFENLFDTLNDCRIINEQQALGFDALAYWNEIGKTAKRIRKPNISRLKQGALAFKNNTVETAPEDKAVKYFKTTYNAVQNCKGKLWQDASEKLAAIMTSLKIEIPQASDE
jgi:hypothetical protein